MTWIKWCPICNGRILTTRQVEENKSCDNCQKQHAREFKNRLTEAEKKEE